MSHQALIAEAERLGILHSGVRTEEVKRRIVAKWIDACRQMLSDYNIESVQIPDKELEDYYHLFLALKCVRCVAVMRRRSANLRLAGETFVPQQESLETLASFMREHSLSLAENASRLVVRCCPKV